MVIRCSGLMLLCGAILLLAVGCIPPYDPIMQQQSAGDGTGVLKVPTPVSVVLPMPATDHGRLAARPDHVVGGG